MFSWYSSGVVDGYEIKQNFWGSFPVTAETFPKIMFNLRAIHDSRNLSLVLETIWININYKHEKRVSYWDLEKLLWEKKNEKEKASPLCCAWMSEDMLFFNLKQSVDFGAFCLNLLRNYKGRDTRIIGSYTFS